MTAIDKWAQIGPWADLKGLPQKCVQQCGKPVKIVGSELEAWLRNGRIASRIRPDRVVWNPLVQQSTTVEQRVIGPSTGYTSYPCDPPPPLMHGTTTASTIADNGGWDQVDWETGTINNGCPIEVNWPSVLDFIEELKQPPKPLQSKRSTGKPAEKRALVEQAIRAELKSGKISLEALNALQKKELPLRYGRKSGAGVTLCYEARKSVLASPD